jgi:hypothetical protein
MRNGNQRFTPDVKGTVYIKKRNGFFTQIVEPQHSFITYNMPFLSADLSKLLLVDGRIMCYNVTFSIPIYGTATLGMSGTPRGVQRHQGTIVC